MSMKQRSFLGWLTIHEANEHIVAQQEFAGASAMREMGFSRALIKKSIAKNSRAQEKIREIGEKLGWDMTGSATVLLFHSPSSRRG